MLLLLLLLLLNCYLIIICFFNEILLRYNAAIQWPWWSASKSIVMVIKAFVWYSLSLCVVVRVWCIYKCVRECVSVQMNVSFTI